ncbi:M12 family metallopeptidase [Marinicellulosiphila megalodicopiae]|uniref:M12 family metallopeptidase n=1 Tax=Marinicellulosiphila megalodicopiae TaxID=2724896 RepID=UPI003BB09D7C
MNKLLLSLSTVLLTSTSISAIAGNVGDKEQLYFLGNLNWPTQLIRQDKTWPNGVIPFQASSLNSTQRLNLDAAILEWESKTNIDFIEIGSPEAFDFGHGMYLTVTTFTDPNRGGVTNTTGFNTYPTSGLPKMEVLANSGMSTYLHELGHVIGLMHEQQRNDRDEYVTIDQSAIDAAGITGAHLNDWKIRVSFPHASNMDLSNGVGPFDFDSIMIYKNHVIPNDPSITIQSGREKLSAGDILTVNTHYKRPFTFSPISNSQQALQINGSVINSEKEFSGSWISQWQLEPINEKYFHFKNRSSGESIHMESQTLDIGIVENHWWSAMWELVKSGDNYQIKNRWLDVYLANNLGDVYTTTDNSQSNTIWKLDVIDNFVLQNKDGNCLNIPQWELNNDEPLVESWDCDVNNKLQNWTYADNNKIVNGNSQCLTIKASGSYHIPSIVIVEDCVAGYNQDQVWNKAGSKLMIAKTGQCLEIAQGQETSNGGTMLASACEWSEELSRQSWNFIPTYKLR